MRAAPRAENACRRSESLSGCQRLPATRRAWLLRRCPVHLPPHRVSPNSMAIGRIVKAADFQRLLASPSRQRSAHFALHHLLARPQSAASKRAGELSTDAAPSCPELVDETPEGVWFGCVVPKRHARRSVTRSMLKRQMRASVQRAQPPLAPGLWLLRLRQPFEIQRFPSADSSALRATVRAELDRLFARAAVQGAAAS